MFIVEWGVFVPHEIPIFNITRSYIYMHSAYLILASSSANFQIPHLQTFY